MDLIFDEHGIWVAKNSNELSYPKEGLDSLFDLEQNSFWLNHRNEIIRIVISRFPYNNDFMDIGGGNGFQLQSIQNNYRDKGKFILCEPGYSGCFNARKRDIDYIYNVEFQNFPFDKYNVGAVGLFDVLEHIEEDDKFISDIASRIGKEKLIYITVPSHNYLRSTIDDYGGHYRRYNSRMVKDLCEKSNVELIYQSYFFSYLVPLTFILRALPYQLGLRLENEKLSKAETNSHQPSSIVKNMFSFFENQESKKFKESSLSIGASLIFVLRT